MLDLVGSVLVRSPLRVHSDLVLALIEGDRSAFDIGSAGAVSRRVPLGEGIARASEPIGRGICSQGFIGDGGRLHGAGAAVGVIAQRAIDHQGALLFRDLVVFGIHITPVDGVGVFRTADIGDRAGGGAGHLAYIGCHQAGEGHAFLGQRRAVVDLGVAAGGDGHFLGQDLQAALAHVQGHAVVGVLRQHRIGEAEIHEFIADVRLLDEVVAQARAALFYVIQGFDRIPNIIAVFGRILFVADQDVVLYRLVGVGEAGLVGLAGVLRAGPAVGLDADRDVDGRHGQGALDVAHGVVVRVRALAGNLGVLGRDNGGTRVDAAIVGGVVRVGVVEANARQAVDIQQALNGHLASQIFGQLQLLALFILLGQAVGGDGRLLLVEQGELQGGACSFLGDLVVGAGLGAAEGSALHGLVQLPAGDGRAAEGEGLADLQHLGVVSGVGYGVAVHVHEVDGDVGMLVAGIVERQHVLLLVSGQHQLLLHLVGVEGDAVQIGARLVQHGVIHGGGLLDDVGDVAVDGFLLHSCDGNIAGILFRIQDVLHRVFDRTGLRDVYEGDHVVGVRAGQLQRRGVRLGAIAGDGDGLLGDLLADHEVRVRDDLVGREADIGLAIDYDGLNVRILGSRLAHVVHGVLQRVARPVGVHGGVRRDLGGEVKQGVPFGGGEPVFEGVARLGGVARALDPGLLFHGLGVVHRGGVLAVHKGDGEGGRGPLGVQHQRNAAILCACRHLVEGIGIAIQAAVVIPPREGVVGVHVALGCSGRPVVGGAVDVRIVLYIRDRTQLVISIVILDLVSMAIVVEVVGRYIAIPVGIVVFMIVGIAIDLFRAITTAGRFLAVQRRQRIPVIIRVLQVIVHLYIIVIIAPGAGHGNAG